MTEVLTTALYAVLPLTLAGLLALVALVVDRSMATSRPGAEPVLTADSRLST